MAAEEPQLAYDLIGDNFDVADRVERVAARLGLDATNYLRNLVMKNIAASEREANWLEAGEGAEG